MNKDDRLEKIEKQLELLIRKVDIIYRKLMHGDKLQNQKLDHRTEDELFNEAKAVVIKFGEGSASILQRRLSIGYARAARILDLLEAEGVIGPSYGAKPRKVLIKK
ncbi:hypothetical protein KKG24_00360 [Patescibacteria group bacterium]|nr:hypothetical protein [Patescibacteria group bacterium]